MGVKPNTIVKGSELSVEGLIFIYKHWLKILGYLYDNYESINCDRFKKLWSPVNLANLRKIVEERGRSYERQLQENKSIFFNTEVLLLSDEMFNVFYLVLLGEDIFRLFMQEINQSLEILRKCQAELSPAVPQNP